MCGRFVVARTVSEIQTIFEVDEIVGDLPSASYNVCPTQDIAIIVDRAFEKAPDGSPLGELQRELHAARWGLVPRWAKSPTEHAPLINGRIESILEKPSFKDSVVRRRCVIPASGYYEWHVAADGSKQPFYINAAMECLRLPVYTNGGLTQPRLPMILVVGCFRQPRLPNTLRQSWRTFTTEILYFCHRALLRPGLIRTLKATKNF